MSEHLQNFINEHRDEFDDENPPAGIWDKVERDVSRPVIINSKKNIIPRLIQWTIGIAALLAVAIFIYIKTTGDKKESKELVKTETDINALSPELAPQVNEFARLINLKQEELKSLAKEQPELYNQFTNDIEQLDSSYNALKNQLTVSPNKEMLIEAMIQNLQLQLHVLNQQLNIIKQVKQSKKNSHEKNEQSI